MQTYTQQIYNCAAMLCQDGLANTQLDRMERHQLRTAIYRLEVALGDKIMVKGVNFDAAAYNAGYEDESE